MKMTALRVSVRAMLAKESVKDRLRDDQGEMGSWLIMAAGLALAAIAVLGILQGWFTDRANDISELEAPTPP